MTAALYGTQNGIDDLASLLRSELSDVLGTLPSGAPAVWVEPPGMPDGGAGLHCVIARWPKLVSQSPEVYEWSVTLRQYDESPQGFIDLDNAIAAMRERFPKRRERILPYDETMYQQATFLLPFYADAYPDRS